ncbi:MAG: aldo/keto reductase [Saprospiraceae bacterium]|nr:aldo/keto reductase [Saprospiraceae bacterium]
MNYRKYTQESINVSEIGFGGWQLGINSGWKGMSEQDAIDLVRHALDAGVNFFDTAPNYGYGTGEIRLGKGLKGVDREKIVVNTKFGHTNEGDTNFDANYIRTSLEGSLKRLQMDYVDSLIIHNPPFEYLDGNNNNHYEILENLKEEGKIKAYGASLDTYEEMKLLLETTESKVVEVFFNILFQDVSRGFNMAQDKDVAIIVKIPLDSGWLTGKYNENSSFEGVRSRWSVSDIKTRAGLVKKIKEILPNDLNIIQAALRFCLAYDAVSTVIPGNTTIQQLTANLKCAEEELQDNLVRELEDFYLTEIKALNLPW